MFHVIVKARQEREGETLKTVQMEFYDRHTLSNSRRVQQEALRDSQDFIATLASDSLKVHGQLNGKPDTARKRQSFQCMLFGGTRCGTP